MNTLRYFAHGAKNEVATWLDFKFKTSLSKPTLAMIEPTLRCPMGCHFCDLPKENVFPQSCELSADTWIRIVRELNEYNPVIRSIYIAGGEPFLRPDLCDMLEALHKMGIGTRLLTIGAFCTPAICDRLLASPMEFLKFSIISPRKAVHDAFVQRPVFDKATGAIRYLRKNGYKGKIGFLTTLSRANVHELKEVVTLAEDLGVDAVLFRPMYPQSVSIRKFGDNRKMPDSALSDAETVTKAVEELRELKKQGAPIANSDYHLDELIQQSITQGGGSTGCHMMYESIFIRPNGDVEICGHMSLGTMGNVAERSVAEVLSSAVAYGARHKIDRECNCRANAFLKRPLTDKIKLALSVMAS